MAIQRIGLTTLPALLLCAGIAMPADGGGESSEYQVKAAFLLAFVRFVEWPPGAFKMATDPLVVGILGKDPFDGALEETVNNKIANGRVVVIRRISDASAAHSCQMVFLPVSETRRMSEVTSIVTPGLLIVGESAGFAERGGMINFIVQDNHVHFQINPSAAARAGLKISSKLLQLADVVSDKPKAK